ncbi:hypothetical protein Dsin_029489 [Dipteronia sinensis]|uniref:Uncharacterized protein n=1 Tax=Dipteronia sinensis TaxID=43782 RepID=A0AAD9ZSF8_9ROSI|nr:hypothetical protein Dsin_029489 [Dipteronia sinensis]
MDSTGRGNNHDGGKSNTGTGRESRDNPTAKDPEPKIIFGKQLHTSTSQEGISPLKARDSNSKTLFGSKKQEK